MARDPYKYFRIEAREIVEGLTQGTLELESQGAAPDRVTSLLRLAHTLKGAARVVKQIVIADAAHEIEDVLAPYRDGAGPVPAEHTSRLLRHLDAISGGLAALDAAPPAAAPPAPVAAPVPAPAPAPVAERPAPVSVPMPVPVEPAPARLAIAETVRVEIAEMDALLEGVVESSVRAGALQPAVAAVRELGRRARRLEEELSLARESGRRAGIDLGFLEGAQRTAGELSGSVSRSHAVLVDAAESVERELEEVQDRAARLRLVAADTLFAPLARAVRDAAAVVTRQVAFETGGGDIRLDAHVLAAVRDALLHVVRNAVAHGIEPSAERTAAGKPAAGRITLFVERRGSRAAFVCRDDGRGIDVAAVARAAREQGLIGDDGAPVDLAAASRLVFQPGLSTSATLTSVSGRGVGLDVVRDVARRFRGDARIDSVPGQGTTVELVVPISLAAIPALAVDAGGAKVWIPLESVARTQRVEASDLARAGDVVMLTVGGDSLRFAALAELLPGGGGAARSRAAGTAVFVRATKGKAALGIDRLLGVRSIVVHRLPALAGVQPLAAGATLDAHGNPELVLDAQGLVDAVRSFAGAAPPPPAVRPPILIIDDSLTTRMLEQSILETAGYEVDLAVSAEDGLAKARNRRYGLFLVDVEMPGMNGFEFIACTKSDPALRDVPAILVTSLSSPEHRRRGEEVGAHAHIVKGEFDEGRLRQLIRGVMG
jgi:two-component system chemotaxis sensor kinase CheA